MIEVEGQYAVKVAISGKDLFDAERFKFLTVIQGVGTELPVMQVGFDTSSRDVVRLISERVPLEVSMGSNRRRMIDASFLCQTPKISRKNKDIWTVSAACIHSVVYNWHRPDVAVSKPMSAIERVISLAKKAYTKVECNLDPECSEDKQNWIQYGTTMKSHLDDVWPHAKLTDSFPVCAATYDSFRIFCMRTLVSKHPKYKFANDGKPESIPYESNYIYEPRTGFMNSLGARGITMSQFDLTSGLSTTLKSKPFTLLTNSDILGQNERFSLINQRPRTLSRNHDPKYWETYINNLTELLLFSSYKVVLQVKNRFLDIRPLDVVYFRDEEVRSMTESTELSTGLWVVCRVSHHIANGNYVLGVEIVRESFVLESLHAL